MKHTAQLIIDMQKAYFNNEALQKEQTSLVSTCNTLIGYGISHNLPVFNVITLHEKNHATWTRNMIEDQAGYLFKDEPDSEVLTGLTTSGVIEVIKTRDSAFFETNLESMLRTLGIEHLIIAGVSTHTCIMFTVADAYAHNFEVTLASDALASHDPPLAEPALKLMQQEYRIKLASVADIAKA